MELKRIWVHPARESLCPQVIRALTRLVPVHFESCPDPASPPDGEPVIDLSGDTRALAKFAEGRRSIFHVAAASSTPAREADPTARIQFSDSEYVDPRLRGRKLDHKPHPANPAFTPESGHEVLASSNGVPVWTRQTLGGSIIEAVALPVPRCANGERPFNVLNGDRFIQLLPLLHFLRHASSVPGFSRPPLRACFMFDDPNLHWKSYGFIPYPEVARLAVRHGFHVAFATVPIDGWWFDRAAVRCFADYSAQLSLLVHGNDHLHAELGIHRTTDAYIKLLAQALRRVERIENRTGLRVARIMAPPHGACNETALACMDSLGYEAACTTPFSLQRWMNNHEWDPGFGLDVTDFGPDGFPVIPRIKISDACEPHLVISAFLDRPLVAFGHHDTVRGGIEFLVGMTDTLNAFGSVRWCSPDEILASNYSTYRDGPLLELHPHSRAIHCTVPDGISEVIIAPKHFCGEPVASLGHGTVRILGGTTGASRAAPPGVPFRVTPGEQIEYRSDLTRRLDFRTVTSGAPAFWAVSRRLICETRDRLAPVLFR